ncbi:hypothetical protein [Aliamphritea spongicola]|nr:hypothetical protein [Aliamphritea spongicola]
MTIDVTFGIAIGAILATVINIYWTSRISKLAERNRREENLRLLAGELLSVTFHFSYTLAPIRYFDEDMKNMGK